MIRPATPNRRALLAAERALSANPARSAPAGAGRRPVSVALVYPNAYAIGMSSLGYQLAMRTIADAPAARVERFFADTAREGSLESGAPLVAFDVVAFSASYEMDEPTILDILAEAGLTVEARERTGSGRASAPLVVMGGVLVSVNRAPLYPFVDAFLHGDAERILPPLLDALAPEGVADDPRARLEAIEGLPGVETTAGARLAAGLPLDPATESWAEALVSGADAPADAALARARTDPFAVAPPPRATLERLSDHPCTTSILTPHTEFSDMALVDLARGCPHHCTFCWIGHNSPAYRQRPIEELVAAIEPWTRLTDRFGLVSSAVGAHEAIDDLCRWMTARDLRVSYSSLRVEEVTQTMLETLARGGQRSITIAPEAGDRRVRRLLGKRILDEEILDVVERAAALGVENLKLYYMTGIPSETEDEAMGIVRFTEKIRETMLRSARGRGRMGTISVNLGIFVPKPNLPLNHIEPTPPAEVKRRLGKIVRALARVPNTRVAASSPDLAAAQAVLSTGGVEAADFVRAVHRDGGDFRRAVRAWRDRSERLFERRREASRLAARELARRSESRPAAVPAAAAETV